MVNDGAKNLPDKPEGLEIHWEDDLLVARLHADYDLAAELYLQAARVALEERYGYRLVIVDARKGRTITAEARRRMVPWHRSRNAPGAVAVLGGDFTTKTLVKMALSAARVLTKRQIRFAFCDTEEEARAWIEKQRKELRELTRT